MGCLLEALCQIVDGLTLLSFLMELCCLLGRPLRAVGRGSPLLGCGIVCCALVLIAVGVGLASLTFGH